MPYSSAAPFWRRLRRYRGHVPCNRLVFVTRFVKRAVDSVRDLYDCMQRGRTFGRAAETAFWVFLGLIPLAAVAGLVAARVTTKNWDEFSPVLGALPGPTRELVASELVKVSKWNGGAVGVTGAIVFIWLASSGVHALIEALELESGEARPWWKKRAIALATCVALSIAVAVLAILGPGLGGWLGHLAAYFPALAIFSGPPTVFGRILRFIASSVVALGYVSGLYWVAVPPKVRRKLPIFPGALVAVLMQACLSFGYSTYVSRMGSGDAYTAGLAIIGLTMMGLYLFVLALLTGAVVNKMIGMPDAPCDAVAPVPMAHAPLKRAP
jgi:membrane protein